MLSGTHSHPQVRDDVTQSPAAEPLLPQLLNSAGRQSFSRHRYLWTLMLLAGGEEWFREASETTQKIKAEFLWLPSQKAELQTEM